MSEIWISIIKYVGIVLIAAGAAGFGTHYVDANVYGNQIAQLKLGFANAQTASISASLSQLQGFISQMNTAGVDYEAKTKILNNKLDLIHRDFLNAAKHTPLPPDCRPDAERVRALDSAIDAANSAAGAPVQSGTTMRNPPEAGSK